MLDIWKTFDRYDNISPHGIELPDFIPSDEDYKLAGVDKTTNYKLLKNLCMKGVQSLQIDNQGNVEEYYDRLKYELKTFKDLKLVDYILSVWDVINFCKRESIPVGVGRGSAAGSLVCYCLGITRFVDPIKYNLYFERFLSLDRVSPFTKDGVTYLKDCADIDIDISYLHRKKVLEYLNSKYRGNTCKTLTLNALSSKLCIKECCKIVGEFSEVDANHVSDLIPKIFGNPKSIDDSIEEVEKFEIFAEENPKIIEIAKKLEGLTKNTGVHPSGVIVSPHKLEEIFPVQLTKEDELISGYDMYDTSDIAVKIDCLGLRCLDVITMCSERVGFDLRNIDVNDESIYRDCQDIQHKLGLFQVEADCNFEVLRKVKPLNLAELAHVVALARPGALDFVDDYVKNKREGFKKSGLNEEYDEILSKTQGVILMQEQTMAILNRVYGFDLVEANKLRKVIGKKLVKEVDQWESKIREAGAEREIPEELTDTFWHSVKKSANYQFNASHAFAYAVLAAMCLYLKIKYPKEFYWALLEMTKHEPKPHEEISKIVPELKVFGLELLPPHLTKSKFSFSIEGDYIRYGLSSIKGVKEKSEEGLNQFRCSDNANKYQVFQAAKDAGLNIGVFSALIQAGMLDEYDNGNRSRLVLEANAFNKLTEREKRGVMFLGPKYDFNLLACIKDCVENGVTGENGKPVMTDKRFKTFQRDYTKHKEIYLKNSAHQSFANWYFERKLLGYGYSQRLKDIFGEGFSDSQDFKNSEGKLRVAGVVTKVKKAKSQNTGGMYITLDVSDENGYYRAIMADSRNKAKCSEWLEEHKPPEKEDIVIMIGGLGDNCFFVDDMSVMNEKIYMKLGDLK